MALGKRFGGFPLLWIVEDRNKQFKSGSGQVGLAAVRTNGWVFEPAGIFFPWAKKKNVLRACVAFFQMMRHQKDVGCCLVRCGKEQAGFLNHMQRFGVLYQRGKIPNGSQEGDVFIFSISGKKN